MSKLLLALSCTATLLAADNGKPAPLTLEEFKRIVNVKLELRGIQAEFNAARGPCAAAMDRSNETFQKKLAELQVEISKVIAAHNIKGWDINPDDPDLAWIKKAEPPPPIVATEKR